MMMPIELQKRLIKDWILKEYPSQIDTIDIDSLMDSSLSFPEQKANIEMHIIRESFKGMTPEEEQANDNNSKLLRERLIDLENKYRNLQKQKIRIVKQEYFPTESLKEYKEWDISDLFSKPTVIGLVGDSNTGKSNLIYWFLKELSENYDFKVFAYGLRSKIAGIRQIFSIQELENIRNSIIMIDELSSIFDFEDRKERGRIEKTLRLISHNNNVLLLCGAGENFKKFVSAKLKAIFFKKTTISDLVNGSRVKEVLLGYNGDELGSSMLNLENSEAVLWDGKTYKKLEIPYLEIYDSKVVNVEILVRKNVKKE